MIPTKPPLRWEVWQGSGWIPATVYRDTTGGLNRDGQITLLIPPVHEPLTLGGAAGVLAAGALLEPEPGQPTYRASPQIRQIRVDSVGGSVTAEHSDARATRGARHEHRQARPAVHGARCPVLPRIPGEAVQVVDGDGHDGVDRGRRLRRQRSRRPPLRVELDDRRGPLRAADPLRRRLRRASTARSRREGALVAATGYRYGGGAAGNVGAGTLIDMRTSLPYVDRVENLIAGDRRRRRRDRRQRQAARTALAARRRPGRHRRGLRAARPRGRPGDRPRALPAPERDRHADPAAGRAPGRAAGRAARARRLRAARRHGRRVSAHLDERRILGTAIEIGTPFYQGVTIAALLTARPGPAGHDWCASGRSTRCTGT